MIIERPRSLLQAQPAQLPPELAPPPSVQALVHSQSQGQWSWTLLRKVSYHLSDGSSPQRASQQQPIHTAYVPHEPLPDWVGAAAGRSGSMKTVPEPRAWQAGTDLVVRAHAASAHPVRSMLSGLVVGRQAHKLRVWGERHSLWQQGRVQFSEPQLFERLPLRSELAYGGHDPHAVRAALAALESRLDADSARRSRAFWRDMLPQIVPLTYARNPIGMGYVADPLPQALHQVALPRLELECDLLTPQRFAQGQPLQWLTRPVPAGLDFMDPRMFPRTAMLGLPPPGWVMGQSDCPEVNWGMVPADFSRGNLLLAEDAHVELAVHPDAVRSAPMGLRFASLGGREPISLLGLRADRPRWDFALPGERPVFDVPGLGRLHSSLLQVFIDVEARQLELLWAACWPAGRELQPGEDQQVLRSVRTQAEVVS